MPRITPPNSNRRMVITTAMMVVSAVLLSSCSKSLGPLVTEAMDGCIAVRNPAFKSGNGSTALDTPLPDSLSTAADKIAYARGLKNLEIVVEQAKDQVTLVCALEIASHYKNGDVGVLLYKYTKHPDAAVALSAKKLFNATQDPLPAGLAP